MLLHNCSPCICVHLKHSVGNLISVIFSWTMTDLVLMTNHLYQCFRLLYSLKLKMFSSIFTSSGRNWDDTTRANLHLRIRVWVQIHTNDGIGRATEGNGKGWGGIRSSNCRSKTFAYSFISINGHVWVVSTYAWRWQIMLSTKKTTKGLAY